jgi:hypothetical protein
MGRYSLPIPQIKLRSKTMTVKMYEVLDFPEFFDRVKSLRLPFKTSYRLTLIAQEVEKNVNYYQDQFRNILQEYGKKDENGNLVPTADGQGIRLVEDRLEEAYGKIAELRGLDIDLPDYTFSADDFDGLELSPEEMVAIIPFIED